VDDDTRGRVFAFFQSSIQVILFAVIAVVPLLSAGLTRLIASVNRTGNVKIGNITYASAGQNVVILLAAAVAFVLGLRAYRQMDDRRGVPLREDLLAAVRNEPLSPLVDATHLNGNTPPGPAPGLLIAFEGGEGSGKTTQARLVAIWLRELGYDVEKTHEPGATKIGMRLRALLLDTSHTGMSPRAEALMYAADRAEHVASVIAPALARGAIVITDRYVDSSLAYQGAGRDLPLDEIAGFNRWATGGRTPDLTILLDMDPMAGLSRRARSADRLEAEPADFHLRVRAGFLALARAEPARYLVLDADRPPAEITREIQERIRVLLPDPVPSAAEASTGDFPAIRAEVLTPAPSPHGGPPPPVPPGRSLHQGAPPPVPPGPRGRHRP
jgi:dTMP kinase